MSFWPFTNNNNDLQDNNNNDYSINKILENYHIVLKSLKFTSPFIDSILNANNYNLKLFDNTNNINKIPLPPRPNKNKNNNIITNTNSNNITINNLDNSFIDSILKNPSLLNELENNDLLIDFISLGFFIKNENTIVYNLDYLIDQLLFCINNLKKFDDNNNNPLDFQHHLFQLNYEKKNNNLPPHILDNFNLNPDNLDFYFNNQSNLILSPPPELSSESKIRSQVSLTNFLLNNNSNNSNDEQKNIIIYFQRANIIAEIFSIDNWLISNSILSNKNKRLTKLWSISNFNFKFQNNNSNSMVLNIFLGIMENFLSNNTDNFLNFIRLQKNLSNLLIKNINFTNFTNFFINLLLTDKFNNPTGIIDLFYDQNLISNLLNYLNSDNLTFDEIISIGDFIKSLIKISSAIQQQDESSLTPTDNDKTTNDIISNNNRESSNIIGPNILIQQLTSIESTQKFIDIMLLKKNRHQISIISEIIIELIRNNPSNNYIINLNNNSSTTTTRDSIYLGFMLKTFSDNLIKIYHLFTSFEKSKNNAINITKEHKNQMNQNFEPLNFQRFNLSRLIAELLHCSNFDNLNYNLNYYNLQVKKNFEFQKKNLIKNLEIAMNDQLIDIVTPNNNNDDDSSNQSSLSNDNSSQMDIDDPELTPTNETLIDTTENNNNYFQNYMFNDETIDNDNELDTDIPTYFINSINNKKLRTNSTIGDLFKIELLDSNFIPKFLELFLKHPWNNLYHNVVFDIIQQILNGKIDSTFNPFIILSLINYKEVQLITEQRESNLIEFSIIDDLILKGYKSSYTFFEVHQTNLGYMGHLILIADEISKFQSFNSKILDFISPVLSKTLINNTKWKRYCEEVLKETRKMFSKILGGGSFIEDDNGKIIPKLSIEEESSIIEDISTEDASVNIDDLEFELNFSTESGLHKKLKDLLIISSQDSVDLRNKENGVIILPPAPPKEDPL